MVASKKVQACTWSSQQLHSRVTTVRFTNSLHLLFHLEAMNCWETRKERKNQKKFGFDVLSYESLYFFTKETESLLKDLLQFQKSFWNCIKWLHYIWQSHPIRRWKHNETKRREMKRKCHVRTFANLWRKTCQMKQNSSCKRKRE